MPQRVQGISNRRLSFSGKAPGGTQGPRPCSIRQLMQAPESGDGVLTVSGRHCTMAAVVGRVMETHAVSHKQEKTGTTFVARYFTISDGSGKMTVRTPLQPLNAEQPEIDANGHDAIPVGRFLSISGIFSFDPLHKVLVIGNPREICDLDELIFHMLLTYETHLRIAKSVDCLGGKASSALNQVEGAAVASMEADEAPAGQLTLPPSTGGDTSGKMLSTFINLPVLAPTTVEERVRSTLAAHPQSTLTFLLSESARLDGAGAGEGTIVSIRRELRRLVAAGDVTASTAGAGTSVVYSLRQSLS